MVDVAESEKASERMSLGYDDVLRWIRAFAAEVETNKEQLTQLDAAVGDGDHGINMQRGMSAVLGKVDGIEGFVAAAGFSGHGIMHAPATGELIAELIVDGRTSFDIAAFRASRFGSGDLIREYNVI